MQSKELSIIIYSCRKNSCMWEPFSILFRKYWPDCPYKVVLVTDCSLPNMEEYVFSSVVEIDATWGKMIKKAIKEANTPYVMLWMDDYLLCDKVLNEDFEKKLKLTKEQRAANLLLADCSWDNFIKTDKERGFAINKKNVAYSLSLQVGIWDVEALLSFIPDEWSPWDFERKGSMISEKIEKDLLTSIDYIFPYEEGVRSGKWMEAGVKLLKRNGYDVNKTGRPIMRNIDMARIYFKGAVLDINPNFIQKIQNIFCKS